MDPEERSAESVRQQIIAALTDASSSHPMANQAGGDREIRLALAASVLRRLDQHELGTIDPQAVARWISWLHVQIDQHDPDDPDVVITVPDTGLDGHPPVGSSVDVLAEDRPFLLSTITDELHQRGCAIRRRWHPIIGVATNDDGRVSAILPARTSAARISVLHLELNRHLDEDERDDLTARLKILIKDVTRATNDFETMRERIGELATQLRFGDWSAPPSKGADPSARLDSSPQEAADLLDWIIDDNMVLLGIRDYRSSEPGEMQVVAGSGLGLLRTDTDMPSPVALADLDEDNIDLTRDDVALVDIRRTHAQATVQRRDHMQQISVRHRDNGSIEEVRILGLFTRKGLAEPVRTTPVLRRKLRAILEREDVVDASHDEGTITALFQALPKDELFTLDLDALHEMVVELFHAEERGEIRTLVRHDDRSPTVSVLISVPRDRYGPQLRQRIEALLQSRFSPSRIDVELSLGQRREALVRFLLHVPDPTPSVDVAQLHAEVAELARSWIDDVTDRISTTPETSDTHLELARRLPAGYRDSVPIDVAVRDVALLHDVLATDVALTVRLDDAVGDETSHLRVARRDSPLELSSFLPILESLGMTVLQEVPHRLEGDAVLYLQDFTVSAENLDAARDGTRLAEAILAAHRGHLAIDRLNSLVLVAGLEWREVMLLRTLQRLRRQLGTTYTPEYTNETIVGQPAAARAIVDYFHARFDPDRDPADEPPARDKVLDICDGLPRLDQDRILRGLVELINATVRTNVFRRDAVADGTEEPYFSLKFDPSKIEGVPRPVPFRETFVHSPGVEGIHLRFGPVARGGLRWSDRRDDVRTEVFDLVKAQLLKNAFIVPTGAKGGFVLTREPADPTALREEVRRQYITFVRGLLDVTDDLDGDDVITPTRVRCHDGDDPYLVVAADRGTATLSDTANAVAHRYGFWLDDAFASGGSNGYDHKALGVTAKGTWMAVRRHFRELGIDVQAEPVTVAGVGDMSGDVFGNGLLQSRAVRLVAAFDHRDIFLDPDPDPERSFEERARLFAMSRSSWQDYDRGVLSPGGGIFARSARTVELTDEMRALLRVDVDRLTPPALIQAILKAPVDLLFAGGIGTYLKSSGETDLQVGDRANDELRVDARDVRARVIGEGANLFITQRGRIEYARRGGHINQDAIDNAAGVATSDCEVNLKILLKAAIDHDRLDPDDRNELLSEFAGEVVDLVMVAVDRQSGAVSKERRRSPRLLDAYDQMMDRLTSSHALDRDVERLPDTQVLAERADAGAGLTRPELATLLAWSKRELKEHLLAGDLLTLELFVPMVRNLFPAGAIDRFGDLVEGHRLRQELTATAIANEIVDRMGVTFITQFADTSAVDLDHAVLAYQIARNAINAEAWWAVLDHLEGDNDPERVDELAQALEQLVAGAATGLVRHPALRTDPEGLAERIGAVVTRLRASVEQLGTQEQRIARSAYVRWLIDDLVDPELAQFLGMARDLVLVPEIADVIVDLDGKRDAAEVADAFLRVGEALKIERLEEAIQRLEVREPWAHRQREGLRSDLRRVRRDAARLALLTHPDRDVAAAVSEQVKIWEPDIATVTALIDDIATESVSLDALAVCARSVHQVVERG
ncbi:MAG: NAD-glutamate dehydrogenase domain-containing protein [Nitriliruptoraceae bacterium]